MKTATNIYIFNLALADALATSTLPFQSAKYLMNTWPFGEPLCKLVIAIDYYNMFTSIFTLTMMSVDRYIAVCHPVRALEFRTPVKAKFINVCVWILSSAIGVPIMVMAVTKVTDQGEVIYVHFICVHFISGHLTITLKHCLARLENSTKTIFLHWNSEVQIMFQHDRASVYEVSSIKT